MSRAPALLILLIAAFAAQPAASQTAIAGTTTHGGAIAGAQVVHVTSLADSGPGSLRAAIQTSGPRVIVFDVAGIIALQSDLKISIPEVTVAGETAPAPGVTLTNASLRIRTHDVIVSHIAVRPGPGATPKVNGNRDAITIGGGKEPARDIRLQNVSTSWSVDEDIDITGPDTRDIAVRNSIVAEALRFAGHPKGKHSMGMLINAGAQGVAITGNLFVSNMFRNPVMARGISAVVADNYIINPADNAIHFYSELGAGVLKATVTGNIVDAGLDTRARVTAVQVPDDMAQQLPDARIYLSGNSDERGEVTNRGGFALAATPPVSLRNPLQAPGNLRQWVLDHAGPWPAKRNNVDARIVSQAAARTARIVDSPPQAAATPPAVRKADVPAHPFSQSNIDGLLRIEAWLCERHLAAGGPPTPECPHTASHYQSALYRVTKR